MLLLGFAWLLVEGGASADDTDGEGGSRDWFIFMDVLVVADSVLVIFNGFSVAETLTAFPLGVSLLLLLLIIALLATGVFVATTLLLFTAETDFFAATTDSGPVVTAGDERAARWLARCRC